MINSRIPHLRLAAERELKGQATDEEASILRSDPTAWRAALVAIKMDLTEQVRIRRLDLDRQSQSRLPPLLLSKLEDDFREWRIRLGTVLSHVEDRIQSVKTLGAERHSAGADRSRRKRAAVDLLRIVLDLTAAPSDDLKREIREVVRQYEQSPGGCGLRRGRALTRNGNGRSL